MKTIWKFLFTPANICTVKMPQDSVVLCAQDQDGGIYLWAMVNPEMPTAERFFQVIGTGWEIDEMPRKYISTVQLANGNLIFHVFEVMKRNIFNSDATCDLILSEEWQSLMIDYHREGLRVVSKDNMIKCQVFSAKENTKFRVRLLIETISDSEDRLLEKAERIA